MPAKSSADNPWSKLPTYDDDGKLQVVIETPKGCRNKYDFDPRRGLFALGGVLPAGAVFPFDFGYVPGTLGADGDPLDVLVLMDEPVFTGCLLTARLIGVIEAVQTERDGTSERNDRLIAVADESHTHKQIKLLEDLNPYLIEEIRHFFASYNKARGKEFKVLGCRGPKRAKRLLGEGETLARRKKTKR